MSARARLWSLALALLLASPQAFAAERVRIAGAQTIILSDKLDRGASHDLVLYAHTFLHTRWRRDVIVQALAEAARLIAPCGVRVERLELRTIEAPSAFHYYSTQRSRELLRWVDVPKPALFFVEDTYNDPAFDAEAIGLANSRTRPELANTVWIAYGARDLSYALAHELVHVLSDSGLHSEEPGNLMRDETMPANSNLSGSQCERMRLNGVANGLLVPRER
ncbi:MAG: hypothetical protein ACXWIH_11540 [Burkholderiales bacterium]